MKITLEQQEKGKELYNELVQKAWESATFKEQLVNNPKDTITKIVGESDFKIDSKIIVEDQTDTDVVYLNIPRKMNLEDIELTEEQLELVAGGGWIGALMGGIGGGVAGFVMAGPVGAWYGASIGAGLGATL